MRTRSLAFVALAGLATSAPAQTPYAGHGAGSIPPEVVKKYAPPPLDPAVSARIQMMLDVRSPGLGIVSPDGRRLYFGWSITGTPAVWRLDGPKSFPVQMTGGEDRTSVLDVTPDGRFLVLSRDHGGQEDPGLYLQPVEGGAPRVLQHIPKSRAFFGFASGDSKSIYFTANDVKPDSYAVYRYDIATATKEPLFSEEGLWQIADHREESAETRLLLQKATGALSSEFYEWGTKDRRSSRSSARARPRSTTWPTPPHPGELLVATNKLGDFRRLYRWKAQGGFTPVTPDVKMDVSDFTIDPARRHVYYALNDGGYTRLRVLDARTLAPATFPE